MHSEKQRLYKKMSHHQTTNSFLGKPISNYSLKAPKETAGGVHITMAIIYSHNFVENHDRVRN